MRIIDRPWPRTSVSMRRPFAMRGACAGAKASFWVLPSMTMISHSTGPASRRLVEEAGLPAATSDVAGCLSSDAITEEDLRRGDYEGARVEIFLVNWSASDQPMLVKVQEIGEVVRDAGQFRAELRSFAHRLNQPQGRVYAGVVMQRLRTADLAWIWRSFAPKACGAGARCEPSSGIWDRQRRLDAGAASGRRRSPTAFLNARGANSELF
jgi:hypothetical protein